MPKRAFKDLAAGPVPVVHDAGPGAAAKPIGTPDPGTKTSLEKAQRCRGVTLLELVLTLFVVAVLALVAVSRRPGSNIDAYSDGETLKAAIRNTRTRAMSDVVPWSFQVAGRTGTFQRNGVAQSTLAFATTGVAAGTVTFDNRGAPSGAMSFVVAGCPFSPVTVTAQTGFVP